MKDHGETFLEVAAILDSIVNVFVLSINSVGARFEEQKEKEKVSNQKSCFEIFGLRNLSFEDEEAETPKEDLLLSSATSSPGLAPSRLTRSPSLPGREKGGWALLCPGEDHQHHLARLLLRHLPARHEEHPHHQRGF